MQNYASGTVSVKMRVSEIVFRVIGILLTIGGSLLLLLSIVALLLAVNGTKVRGTVVADSCSVSLGRGTTTSYECKGTFTPDDPSISSIYLESNAGGGILVGKSLEVGVPYSGYAVGGFGEAKLSEASQVVVDGDTQSQRSGFMGGVVLIIASLALLIPGILFCLATTKKARLNRAQKTISIAHDSSVKQQASLDNISHLLDDPTRKLSVKATKVSGMLDSAIHGGGKLILQNGHIRYQPRSQKVTPLDIAVAEIVKINVRKSRFELYLSNGAHYTFVVTMPVGGSYAYVDATDPFDLIVTALSLGNVADNAAAAAKANQEGYGVWDVWVQYIVAHNQAVTIEHKSRTPRLLAGIALVIIVPFVVFVAIVLAVVK